jgi:putative SOS response-associated peptidase YedK
LKSEAPLCFGHEKAPVVLRRSSIERIKEVALQWLDMPAADKKELQKTFSDQLIENHGMVKVRT